MDIRFTKKQIEILDIIRTGNSDGSRCDVYDIISKLTYTPKRDALLHGIKVLVEKGYIERRDLVSRPGRVGKVRIFTITTKALEYI